MLEQIKLNERIKFDIDSNIIHPDAIPYIQQKLTEYHLPPLPNTFQWVKVVSTKEEYTGSFITRLRKWYYKQHSIKLAEELTDCIWNRIISFYVANLDRYEFDFTDKFDWRAGDFGDNDSCFWGGRSVAKDCMEYCNGLAVRFYNVSTGRGYSRAWITKISDDAFVCWNAYGMTLSEIANVLCRFFNCNFKVIDLRNSNDNDRWVYINGDYGYILSIKKYARERINLKIKANVKTCDGCGDIKHFRKIKRYKNIGEYDVLRLCEYCIKKIFRCKGCHKRYLYGCDGFCNTCAKKYLDICHVCGHRGDKDTFQTIGGFTFCSSCSTLYKICAVCNAIFPNHYIDNATGLCVNCNTDMANNQSLPF